MTGLEKRRTKGIQECISSLETLFKYYKNDSEFNYQLEVSDSEFNFIKKYLKALEIIKKKKVDYSDISFCKDYEQYKVMVLRRTFTLSPNLKFEDLLKNENLYILTEEEFEILKEVFK